MTICANFLRIIHLTKSIFFTFLAARNRIKIISQSLSRRDPNLIIQKEFSKSNVPKYIIVDAFLTLDTVKSVLGFKNLKQMKSLLQDVIFVKPDWVNQKGDLHSPTIDQCWTGGHELKKRKHDCTPSSQESGGWIKRIRKAHEFAPITKISAAEVNNPVIDYLYKRNMDKFHDISFKNQKRNLPLSKLLKDISTIYKESPLQKFDDWRSYSYSRCAGRIQYLEFEVTLDDQSLDRLSKVHGFGAKVVKQVSPHIVLRLQNALLIIHLTFAYVSAVNSLLQGNVKLSMNFPRINCARQ